jgi:Helix-turn-helix domain
MDESLPPFLRIEEAARLLRISKSAAYEQANAWIATGGQTGLPVVVIGRTKRVPRAAMLRMLTVGAEPSDAVNRPAFPT